MRVYVFFFPRLTLDSFQPNNDALVIICPAAPPSLGEEIGIYKLVSSLDRHCMSGVKVMPLSCDRYTSRENVSTSFFFYRLRIRGGKENATLAPGASCGEYPAEVGGGGGNPFFSHNAYIASRKVSLGPR